MRGIERERNSCYETIICVSYNVFNLWYTHITAQYTVNTGSVHTERHEVEPESELCSYLIGFNLFVYSPIW